jgi:hypothetical protein
MTSDPFGLPPAPDLPPPCDHIEAYAEYDEPNTGAAVVFCRVDGCNAWQFTAGGEDHSGTGRETYEAAVAGVASGHDDFDAAWFYSYRDHEFE